MDKRMKWRAAHSVAMLCVALGVDMLCTVLAACGPALAEQTASVSAPEDAVIVDLSALSALPDGVSEQDGDVVVEAAGTYFVTGALEGCLAVSAGKKDEVTLVLNGVSIENPDGPAIYVENAKLTTIELPEGAENALRSGEASALEGGEAEADAEGGAVLAKDDLTIAGEGALFVGGYLNNGVQTSNALLVEGGQLKVEAVNNGLKGKDSVTLAGGSVKVTALGDGVKSDSDEGEGFGVVTIAGGALDVTSGKDAVQAETLLEISGGAVNAVSGGGSQNAPAHEGDRGFGGRGMGGFDGMKDFGGMDGAARGMHGMRGGRMGDAELPEMPDGETLPEIPEGETPPEMPEGETPPEPPEGEAPQAAVSEQDEVEPDGAKGLKSGGILRVTGGAIAVDAADDALHANGSVEIAGGSLTLASGDDGVHADEALAISGGALTVTASYEGLEANKIALTGGEIDVTASDDGVNANGGSASWGRGFGFMVGAADAASDEEMPDLLIAGGTLHVDARGDGLDSNGNIRVEGGDVVVDGPSDTGNGALDSGAESGGVCEISGGTVLAISSAGMAETFDEASAQASFQHVFESALPAGTTLTVTDASGNTLCEHVAARGFDCVVFSCPSLSVGDTVTLTADGQSAEITLSQTVTRSGESAGMRGGRGMMQR